MPSPSRSLADDIRQRSDDELTELLVRRPDLARPAPSDLTALAARSSTRASTARAIDGLDLGRLQVLEAAAVSLGPADAEGMGPLLGTADAAAIDLAIEDLRRLALLWRAPEGLVVSRTVSEVLGPHIAGLGPTAEDLGLRLPAETAIKELVSEAPPRAAAILDRLTWGPPVGILPGTSDIADGPRWLLEKDLVRSISSDQVVLPREVALVLRKGRVHPRSQLVPPALESVPSTVADVDATAGGAASNVLVLLDEILSDWSTNPPRVLRTGGLGVRELATLARKLDVPTVEAGFLLEVAAAAGLLADDEEVEPHWTPTAEFDTWQEQPPSIRWASVASAWLSMIRAPHLVGHRASSGESPANALGPDVAWPPIRSLRRSILDVVAEAAPGPDDKGGLAAPTVAGIVEALTWRRPRRIPRDLAHVVAAVAQEGQWLGVIGRGAVGTAGRALLAAPDDLDHLGESIATFLPATVDAILLQADLTAIAPGPVAGAIATFLRSVADVESRGGATVHRFSETSLRRGLDGGWGADQILGMLAESSRTPVPQPLEYLVRDVARKHGQVRVSGVRACVRAEDPAILDEMEASRSLGALQFRRIAPTVLTSPVAPDIVLDLLRESGFAPVAESAAGTVTLAAKAARRAQPRATSSPTVVHTIDADHAAGLIASLRSAEANAAADRAQRHTRSGPAIPANDPTTSVAILREAVAEGHAVWLGYADATGSVRRLLFYPERVDGGRVSGTADGATHVLSIHRITGVVAS